MVCEYVLALNKETKVIKSVSLEQDKLCNFQETQKTFPRNISKPLTCDKSAVDNMVLR